MSSNVIYRHFSRGNELADDRLFLSLLCKSYSIMGNSAIFGRSDKLGSQNDLGIKSIFICDDLIRLAPMGPNLNFIWG